MKVFQKLLVLSVLLGFFAVGCGFESDELIKTKKQNFETIEDTQTDDGNGTSSDIVPNPQTQSCIDRCNILFYGRMQKCYKEGHSDTSLCIWIAKVTWHKCIRGCKKIDAP